MTKEFDYLLEQGRIGNRDVVEHLVTNYYDGIAHLAFTMLDDRDEADEIAQQTMLRAADNIEKYRPHTNLRAWVYKIGLNLARAALRRKKRRERLRNLLQLGAGTQAQPSPEQVVIGNERSRLLRRAVAQLDDKHRIPLLLHYDHDLTTAEIADVLKLPHGTVRSRLHYARRQLHRHLVEVA